MNRQTIWLVIATEVATLRNGATGQAAGAGRYAPAASTDAVREVTKAPPLLLDFDATLALTPGYPDRSVTDKRIGT